MISSVLTATPIAEVCFLQEALFWLTLRRFPIRATSQYAGDDGREDDEWSSGLAPNLANEPVSKSECEFSNLPPHPDGLQILQDDYVPSRRLEGWLTNAANPAQREARESEIARTKEYEEKLALWQRTFKTELNREVGRLFLALREGKVPATGKRIENSLLLRLIEDEQKREVEYQTVGALTRGEGQDDSPPPRWDDVGREPIPKEFWNVGNINWVYSCSPGEDYGFTLILLDTAALFKEFPIPEKRHARQVSQIGDFYVLLDDEGQPTTAAESRAGRKPFPWDEFHVEMAKRILEGQLAPKQESMINAMQKWCKETWGREPARSTMTQKLKLYYDTFVRPRRQKQ